MVDFKAMLQRLRQPGLAPVASGVHRLGVLFVNVYFVDAAGGWVLIDTGVPHAGPLIRDVAELRYGRQRPQAIVLTHGHFDHAGSALDLAQTWDVPVYAHLNEMPYLTGKSDYPPKDPTVGGAMGFFSRFFPDHGYDLGDAIATLPLDGSLPGMPGWRWIYTPGHAPGHISLFRENDRTLLAGDALATMDMDSWKQMLVRTREFDRPPAPFTCDWHAARQSVEQLAELQPAVVAAGHGLPLTGPAVAQHLQQYRRHFTPPRRGRYADQPAITDAQRGVVELPPPVPDPFPARIAGAAMATSLLLAMLRRQNRSPDPDAPAAADPPSHLN